MVGTCEIERVYNNYYLVFGAETAEKYADFKVMSINNSLKRKFEAIRDFVFTIHTCISNHQ